MKKWTTTGSLSFYMVGLLAYLVGLNFLAFSFKYKGIAVASMLFIMFNVITLAIADRLLFDERISTTKMIGIGLAFVAMALMELD